MAELTLPSAVSGYFAALRDNDPEAFAGVFAPDGLWHDPVGSEPLRGRDAIREMLTGFLPTWQRFDGITEDEAFTSGNAASVRWHGHGVNQAGGEVSWSGINTFLLDETGHIATLYAVFDAGDLAQQLNAH